MIEKAPCLSQNSKGNLSVELLESPLDNLLAWEVEQFLVKMFEYGNYSFRAALLGDHADVLTFVLCLVREENRLLGIGACLYRKSSPNVAILGPVGVSAQHRGQGLGSRLVNRLLRHLDWIGCKATFLGMSPDVDVTPFYEKSGFTSHSGVVLCRYAQGKEIFDNLYQRTQTTLARPMDWGDFADVSALYTHPGKMYSFDFTGGLLSSRYVELPSFLPVFPALMKSLQRRGGLAYVMESRQSRQVVGMARILRADGSVRKHVGELEFYLHDNFLGLGRILLDQIVHKALLQSIERMYIWCIDCDTVKRELVESIDARVQPVAHLHRGVVIDRICHNTTLYEITG
jgi:GNAT superfamily N-acetyltransferase